MAQLNPYAGGNVVVNATPYTQYALQQSAHQRAKRDALDQYYNNVTRSVNTAGVRTQDIEGGLARKIQDWQTFAMQNKEHLNDPRKDGYKTLNEFNNRYQDILNDAQKSKQAAAMEMQIGGKVFDMKKDDTLTDDDLNIAHRMGQSIYHPDFYKEDGHTPYSLNDLTIGVPMPKQEYVDHFLDSLAGNAKPTTIGVNATLEKGQLPYQYNQKKTETIGYDPNTLNTIAAGALGYHGDRALEKYFTKQYETPQQRENLNAIFKARTGQDIQSADDIARAMAFQRHGNTQTKVSEEKMVDQYGMQNAMADKRFGQDKALVQMKAKLKGKTQQQQSELLDGYINELKQTAMQHPTTYTNSKGNDANGNPIMSREQQYEMPLSPVLANALKNGKDSPNKIVLTADGKVKGLFYKIDPATKSFIKKNGVYAVDNDLTTTTTLEGLKLHVGKELIGTKNTYGETADDYDGNDNEGAGDKDSGINPDDIKQFGGTIRANR